MFRSLSALVADARLSCLDTVADEDGRAGRLAEHHGASQRLLAAHHPAAQHGPALPPAR